MKVIHIYLDDKTHKHFSKVKRDCGYTWETMLKLGFSLMIRELKGGAKDERKN